VNDIKQQQENKINGEICFIS